MTERVVRVSLAAQVNGFVNGMNQAEQAARKAKAGSEEATAAYERQKQAMNEAGVALGAVGAVAMASTALAVKAAIDWESAWAGVTKTVDGSASEMAALEDELRSLTSTLPATHEQIAAVAEAAGQLGVRRDDVADFTRTMVNLGETTNLSADQAATSIAQLMNVMQTAPDDVDRLGATLVALGNDGASTESEILEMAQRIAGAGKLVGATEGEVLGLSNALASMGVTAELGGGVASRILQDLYSAVQSGGDQLAGFAKVAGVSAKQFADQFRADPVRALDAFAKGLNDVEASGGNVVATLSDIGFRSTEEQRVLLQLKGAGDLLADSLDLQAVAWEENLALQVEASKRYETTEAKLAIASNGIREAAIDIGSTFLPAVSAGAEAVATLSFAFAGLPQPVQAGVGVVGALGGVVTLTAGAFLLAVPKIAELGATLDVLRTSQMPGVARAADLASAAVTRTTRATAAAARFMTGPWGLALAAASAGALAWVAANEKMQTEAATFRDTPRRDDGRRHREHAGDDREEADRRRRVLTDRAARHRTGRTRRRAAEGRRRLRAAPRPDARRSRRERVQRTAGQRGQCSARDGCAARHREEGAQGLLRSDRGQRRHHENRSAGIPGHRPRGASPGRLADVSHGHPERIERHRVGRDPGERPLA
ncbi:phage tail tape measure protein [Microbacterium arborescens]|uniref:phage tail tape measure protein n=1 Tax=Microbacterium arborescens TaxID=33883 RepID=UPI0027D8E5D1|nr:phage tail tape measure protein [Microbacterium arborescens]